MHFHFVFLYFFFYFFYFFFPPTPVPCSDTSALSEWHWHTVNRSLPLPSNNIKHTQAEAGAHKFQQGQDIFLRIAFTQRCVLINFFSCLLFFFFLLSKNRKSPNFFFFFCTFPIFYSHIWTPCAADCVSFLTLSVVACIISAHI